jgi:hypothetical protein
MENEQTIDQPSMSHRRKKRSLTDTEKTQIYRFHQENPLVTHSDIAGTASGVGLSYDDLANSRHVLQPCSGSIEGMSLSFSSTGSCVILALD